MIAGGRGAYQPRSRESHLAQAVLDRLELPAVVLGHGLEVVRSVEHARLQQHLGGEAGLGPQPPGGVERFDLQPRSGGRLRGEAFGDLPQPIPERGRRPCSAARLPGIRAYKSSWKPTCTRSGPCISTSGSSSHAALWACDHSRVSVRSRVIDFFRALAAGTAPAEETAAGVELGRERIRAGSSGNDSSSRRAHSRASRALPASRRRPGQRQQQLARAGRPLLRRAQHGERLVARGPRPAAPPPARARGRRHRARARRRAASSRSASAAACAPPAGG